MDTIFGIARKRFNRTMGYWIVEETKDTKVWSFVSSHTEQGEAEASLGRYSIVCTHWVD